MDRWLRNLAGLPLALAAVSALSQASAPATTGLEFDQLILSLPAGQPAPPPEAFEQQYAAALQALRASPSPTSPAQLQALADGMPAPSTSSSLAHQRARMVAAGAGEMAQGLVLRSVPLLGAAADAIEQGVSRHVANRRMERMQALVARQNAWAQAMLNRPRVTHVSLWGDRVRVDNRDGGQVLLVVPERGQRVLLDPASRTYRPLPPVPPPPGAACDVPVSDVAALDARTLGGVAATGYRYRHARTQPATGRAGEVNYVRYVGGPVLARDALMLASGPGCPADSPAATSMPGGDRLVLYQAATVTAPHAEDRPPEQDAWAAMLERTRVLWRGHLSALGADASDRFEIPGGYRPASPP